MLKALLAAAATSFNSSTGDVPGSVRAESDARDGCRKARECALSRREEIPVCLQVAAVLLLCGCEDPVRTSLCLRPAPGAVADQI